MKNKRITYLLLAIFLTASTGFIYLGTSTEGMLKTHNVKIEKTEDNTWRVRDNHGNSKGTMTVKAGDKINWQANGSDMVFIFSEDLKDYFDFEEGMFEDGRTQKIQESKMLRVTLKGGAPKGTLQYEVYVIADNKSVIGNSPPRIIIR